MKKNFFVLLAASFLLVPGWGECGSDRDSLEKQLFDCGNRLFRITRELGALKEDLIAVYAQNPSEGKWHEIKMAVNKLTLAHRVSYLTSLSIREVGIIRSGSKHVWCEGQKAVIAASIRWAKNDCQATKRILDGMDNQEASRIMKKGIEQIEAAILVYKQGDELLDQLLQKK